LLIVWFSTIPLPALDKVLTVTLRFRPDGTALITNVASQIDRVGAATQGAERRIGEFNLAAIRQNQVVEGVSSKLRGLLLSVTALGGAAGIGLLIRRGYDYNQQLEAQRNALAAILAANRQYVDSNGQLLDANAAFQAGLAESDELLVKIQKSAVETAATVPQISDAFATALSASKSSGLKQDLDAILQSTVRLVQAAGAFNVPLDQIRQEVNSLFMGQITEDSVIARKLGFDSASVRRAISAGKLYEEIIRRTDAIAVAAKAQSNTLSGVIVNVGEMIDMTISKAINSSLGGIKQFVSEVGESITASGPQIAAVVTVITDTAGEAISRVREWTKAHEELIEEIAAIGAVVGGAVVAYGLIGAAIAAITSPIGLTIAAIVALALAWEKAREFGQIEVAGRPISAYIRSAWDFIGGATAAFVQGVLTTLQVLWHGAKAIFGSLVEVIIWPIHQAATLIAELPDSVASAIPGGETLKKFAANTKELLDTTAAAFEPLNNFKQIGADIGEGWSVGGALFDQTLDNMEASLKSKEKLPSIADTIFGGVADAFRKRIAELNNTAANPPKPAAGAKGGNGAPVIPQEVKRAFDEYLAFVEDVRRKGEAAGDPVAEALANVDKQRREALRKIEEARSNSKFAQIGHNYDADVAATKASFEKQELDALNAILKQANERTIGAMRALRSTAQQIESQIESDRIAQIKDASQRELAERLQANKQWFEAERERVDDEIQNEAFKYQILIKLATEKKRRDQRDRDEAERQRDEELVGLYAWTDKVQRTIREKIGKVPQQITDSVLASVDAVQSGFNSLFDGLVQGQLNLAKSVDDFAKQLGSIWSHLLSNMLTRTLATGDSIISQLTELMAHVNNLHGADAALAGAGIGSFVGGIGQAARPNSNASLGGTIGGVIGAVIGSFVGATGLGAIIGSAIGTAVGSAIQKGKDHISVAISAAANGFGLVSVVEKGISAAARGRLTRDIQRQTNDVVKSYQSLIDLFPDELRAQIRQAVKPIDIKGGVEEADITDENALQSLSTFLSETMEQGVFSAYSDALRKGLTLLGVSSERIEQEFQHYGDLQGKELQDAVRAYVSAVVGTKSQRDKFNLPFETVENAAREGAGQTELSRISALNGPIAQLVDSLSRLDVTDQVSAAQQLNQLTEQKYQKEIAYLQHIDAIQDSISKSSQQLRDQIKLAGLDDQGKLDFDFERIRGLRSQLQLATDPDQIQSITQQIHGYVSQALSLGGNNAGLRDQLMQIVDDVEAISGGQLSSARAAVEQQHRETVQLLQSAAEALMGASNALLDAVQGTSDDNRPAVPKPGDQPDTGRARVPRFRTGGDAVATAAASVGKLTEALDGNTARIDTIRSAVEAAMPQALATNWAQFDDGVALAVTNLRELNQALGAARQEKSSQGGDMQAVVSLLQQIADRGDRELQITGDGRGLLEQLGFAVEERVIRRVRRDPDVLRGFSD
jgi:hypothetical protein